MSSNNNIMTMLKEYNIQNERDLDAALKYMKVDLGIMVQCGNEKTTVDEDTRMQVAI